MSKWVGYAVSVNCGEPLGCYQGTILEADGSTITLTKAFRNGFPYPKSQVTLNAADIKELKIIEAKTEPTEQTHSTVAVTKNNKKCHRATVCENLQANPTSSGNQANVNSGNSSKGVNSRGPGPGPGPVRSKPIEIQPSRPNKNNTHAGSYVNASSTPKGRGGGTCGGGGGGYDKARRRNEACFGEAAEAFDDDFDFEGNLALFDKRALWERMRHANKPDLLRQADDSTAKLRHDENVLGGECVSVQRGIVVPEEVRGPLEYASDDGVLVTSVLPGLRRQLYDHLDRLGLGECTRTLLARAACDVALRLAGGARRLEPRNAHQAPHAVALLGPHNNGAVGARCLRLLMSHGARGSLHVGGDPGACVGGAMQRELAALALDDARPAALAALPTPDIVLLATYDVTAPTATHHYSEILQWARSARAAIVAIEPPPGGWGAWGVTCRASVCGILPPTLDDSLGRLYLAALAPPHKLLRDLRIIYRPPFGANAVISLHPTDRLD